MSRSMTKRDWADAAIDAGIVLAIVVAIFAISWLLRIGK